MRRDSFNVLFFIKKTKLLKNGEASVCMRITVNGARVETNIRKSIEPVSWNQAKECARGKSRNQPSLTITSRRAESNSTEFIRNLKRMGNLSLPEYCRKSSSEWTKRWSKYAPSSVLCVSTTSNAELWWVKISP